MNQPQRPPITRLTQPAEQLTFLSQIQSWLYNTFMNAYLMMDSEDVVDLIRQTLKRPAEHKAMQGMVKQIRDIPGSTPDKDTLVLFGSGPSLTQYTDFLPWVFEHCYTIASPTVVPWLDHHELYPDIVFNADQHPILAEHCRGTAVAEISNLVCSPETSAHLPQLFGKDKTYWYRTVIPGPNGELDWEPYSMFMTFMMSVIQTAFPQQGCVTNVMISLAWALSEMAGWKWKRIVLMGCDYGFWDGYGRLPTDGSDDLLKWALTDGGAPDLAEYHGTKTLARMLRYKAGMLLDWKMTRFKIYTMSHGILEEFPAVTQEEWKAGEWAEYISEFHIGQRTDWYLNWFNQFIHTPPPEEKSKIIGVKDV